MQQVKELLQLENVGINIDCHNNNFSRFYVFTRAYAVLPCRRQNMNTIPFNFFVLNNGEKYFTILSFFSSPSACRGYSGSTEEVYTKQLEMRDTKRAHDHFQFQFLCLPVCPIKLSYTYLQNKLF